MRTLAPFALSLLAVCALAACGSSSASDDMPTPSMDGATSDATEPDGTTDASGNASSDAAPSSDAPSTNDATANDATANDAPSTNDATANDAAAKDATPGADATLDAGPADAGTDATLGPDAADAALFDAGSSPRDASVDAGIDAASQALTCAAAASAKGSVGCDFFAVEPESYVTDQCFAAYVVNGSSTPAHLSVELPAGTALDPTSFAVIPSGIGANITYTPYDGDAGLPPGQTAFLFLAGDGPSGVSGAACPVDHPAVASASILGTGTTPAFHVASDVPVSAYQMSAYGSANSIAGGTLLLPTSAWGTNYVAVTAAPTNSIAAASPSINIVAYQDNTQVTLLPTVAIAGGGSLSSGPAAIPYVWTLNRGEQAQFSQQADLTGSIVQANHPVGVLGANACMAIPTGATFCDHGEQMLPPVQALGSAYAAVMFRPRVPGDTGVWRLVGVVDGTQLTYSPTIAGSPLSLSQGQSSTFMTNQPFTVQSQDGAHPFLLFELMTGGAWSGLSDTTGYGDPEIMAQVSPSQFGTSAAFVTDPTFPETNLVVVRATDSASTFRDVTLDCAGTLTGWQSLGAYEWTRIDLTRHDFAPQGNCTSGTHSMSSAGPFGVSIWGWGSPESTLSTTYVSYGYQAAMSAAPINSVVVSASP